MRTQQRRAPAAHRLAPGLLITALVAVLGLTAAAPAQFGQAAGFGEMMSPYFLRRDLVLFVDGLDLDEGQSVILESLFWDYEDEHEAGKMKMLERLSAMREDIKRLDRSEVLKLVFEPFEDRAREWTEARAQFIVNVQAILNDEQLQRWPEFERMLRREKELPSGRLSGENVDLHHVLKFLDVEPQVLRPVEALLAEYDVAIDAALLRRENLMQESRIAMMRSIREEDPQSAVAIYEQQVDARVAVRDTNDAYAAAIAEALPVPVNEMFRKEVRERAYPRIFRPTAAERLFEEAKTIEGLSTETLTAIENLQQGMLAEIGAINAALVDMLKKFEPEDERYRAANFAQRSKTERPEKPTDPTREEFRRREEVGRRYVAMLEDLLTPEQFASLKGAQRFVRRQQREAADRERMGASPPAGRPAATPMAGQPPKKKTFGGRSDK